VTSPKDYRNRFRVAMSKYILLAPNCWHQFQAQQIQGRPVRFAPHGSRDEEELTSVEPNSEVPVLGKMSGGGDK
jgi:1-phosphatidylinositol-3-phosphate 5-kinase